MSKELIKNIKESKHFEAKKEFTKLIKEKVRKVIQLETVAVQEAISKNEDCDCDKEHDDDDKEETKEEIELDNDIEVEKGKGDEGEADKQVKESVTVKKLKGLTLTAKATIDQVKKILPNMVSHRKQHVAGVGYVLYIEDKDKKVIAHVSKVNGQLQVAIKPLKEELEESVHTSFGKKIKTIKMKHGTVLDVFEKDTPYDHLNKKEWNFVVNKGIVFRGLSTKEKVKAYDIITKDFDKKAVNKEDEIEYLKSLPNDRRLG